MANYYFLATLLPPLKVGSPVELGSHELWFLLQQNLEPKDLESIFTLKLLVDIENIRAIWQKQPFRPGGNFEQFELEDRLFFKEGLPKYVLDYLEQYNDKKDLIDHFPQLLHSYFAIESKDPEPFVSKYLTFEWHWRLVFVALRAHDLNRNIEDELKAEDLEDPFISDLIAATKEKNFEPPAPYTGLKALYESRKLAPLDLYQALSEWRFDHIENVIEWEYFSLDRILGYIAQLEICEEWLQLDKLKGLEIVDEMMDVS